jgi:hypothetical protein
VDQRGNQIVAEVEALANWVALHHRKLTTIYITTAISITSPG